MKNSLNLISIVCIFLLTSCQPKSVTLTDVSPNKKVTITVKAKQAASLEPWKVEIDVKAYDFRQGSLAFELQSGDINDKSVKFDWKDDHSCVISFEQPDGVPRTFQLLADENQVQLAEINL
jgi:hypothetical protein